MATNSNVTFRLAEAFARHGVAVTFGQSLSCAFHLAAPVQRVSRTTTDKNAFQGLDHLKIFAPVVKGLRRIDRAGPLAAATTNHRAGIGQRHSRLSEARRGCDLRRARDAVDFSAIDLAAITRTCGAEGRKVERGEDVGAALDAALRQMVRC
jgi:thiamine pyrophosphate-dependent acetolactate synthase large subunit-like protein